MISFPAGMAVQRPASSAVRLDPTEIHVWSIDLDDLDRGNDVAASLSAEEQARAERISPPAQRHRFIACRAAVRSILAGYLDRPAADVLIEQAAGGKPRLASADNPLDLRFNLTHSGPLAVLVVANGVEVGVDVEIVRPIRAFESMLARCLAPAEREAILQLPLASRDREFLRYWSHKEAYLKAVGEGIRRPLTSIVVDLGASPYWRVFDHSGIEETTESWLVEMEPQGDMVGALAWLDGSRRGIEVFTWASAGANPPDSPAPAVSRPAVPLPAAPLSAAAATPTAAPMTAEDVRDWIADYVARHLGVPSSSIDVAASFDSFALDSAIAIEMTGDLERLLGKAVDPMLVYDYPTIEKLADHLATRS